MTSAGWFAVASVPTVLLGEGTGVVEVLLALSLSSSDVSPVPSPPPPLLVPLPDAPVSPPLGAVEVLAAVPPGSEVAA